MTAPNKPQDPLDEGFQEIFGKYKRVEEPTNDSFDGDINVTRKSDSASTSIEGTELRETDLDHNAEDQLTKELVGFANDLLAYNHRMTEVGSPILFIHKYVAKREKRFRKLIRADRQELIARVVKIVERKREVFITNDDPTQGEYPVAVRDKLRKEILTDLTQLKGEL